jgi:putative transposase
MRLTDPVTGRSYYSKQLRRFDETNQPRELTFSCYRRYPFLARERTREWFLQALEAARPDSHIQLWAYVVMPEHVHLIVCPNELPGQVSHFLRVLKETVARRAIAYLKRNAPEWLGRLEVREGSRVLHRFWQPGGGYDRNITETSTLRQMIEYIHANPVRRGLTERAEDWQWSSARWFSGIRPVRVEMDTAVIEVLADGS